MSKADDLLSRALEELKIHGDKATWGLIGEIEEYLDAPKKDDMLRLQSECRGDKL